MIIDCCFDLYFDVVSGESLEPVDVDDIGLHVDYMDPISEWVEVL